MKKPILLTGHRGQLGHELLRSLSVLGPVLTAERSQLDLTNPDSMTRWIREHRPGLIVNAAAYTAVDKAETDVELAWAVNARAPRILAEEAARLGAGLVHYSTDYVFAGDASTPYRETAPTAPLNVYGTSKLAGEQAITAIGAPHLILRTSWVYGHHGQNFVRTILRLAAERTTLRVVNDQVGTPTSSRFLADCTLALLNQDWRAQGGLYHLTPSGHTSWHGFACAIVNAARQRGQPLLLSADAIEAIPSTDYPTPARRPANSRLDTQAIQQAFGLHLPDWQTVFARHMAY
jgi:dTDP-4-dehydrorhamnose reductase